jgi:hypothetical protein
VGSRAVLDAVVKRKILSPRRESNPRTPIDRPVAQSLYRLSYHGSILTAYSGKETPPQVGSGSLWFQPWRKEISAQELLTYTFLILHSSTLASPTVTLSTLIPLILHLLHHFTLNMEAGRSSEALVSYDITSQRRNSEVHEVSLHRCEDSKLALRTF